MEFLGLSRRLSASVLALLIIISACSGSRREPVVGELSPRRTSGNVLTAADIENQPTATSIEDLLQRMPGVMIRSGGPGGANIQISGRSGPPLFVIDGVPISGGGSALGLNPRDIERIEILKDGGTTAEYGFRGGNGVILVTTKR